MTTKEQLQAYCQNLSHAELSYPFDTVTAVYKVKGKMFALFSPEFVNLKCDPSLAQALRNQYPCVRAGWHMNKAHWNSITWDAEMGLEELCKQIDHSYLLIVQSLPKKERFLR